MAIDIKNEKNIRMHTAEIEYLTRGENISFFFWNIFAFISTYCCILQYGVGVSN